MRVVRQFSKSVLVLGAVLFALCGSAEAQQPEKVRRIGFVSPGSSGDSSSRLEALRQGLAELGWIDGKTIAIEARWGEGNPGRTPVLAAELVQLKVEVLVLSGGVPAAKQTTTVPVVFVATTDLVSTGLVESLARPGGNVTGLTFLAPELDGKRLELLKQTVPKLTRVAFLYSPANPPNKIELKLLRDPAAALGVTLRPVEAGASEQIEQAFSTMIRERAEGLSTASGVVNNVNRRRIVQMANQNNLPAVYHTDQFVEDGGLMSYAPNLSGMYRRAAYFVDRILKGAKPADLPVEQPSKFELVMNLKTAKKIGLTIRQTCLRGRTG